MRILTTAAQVRRVSGIDGPGDFPDYPYTDLISPEVGRVLLDGLSGVPLPGDRDFLNDDGGWSVIYDAADEFEQRYFGLPAVNQMEDIRRIECIDGEVWWRCTALANNETGVDYVFKESVAPPEVLSLLMKQYESMSEV